MRLLYYFPKESVPLIARRLDELDVSEADGMERCVRNGVRADHLIDGIGWCRDTTIRKAMSRVLERAKDRDVLEALERSGFAKK